MQERILADLVTAFNRRAFAAAAQHATEGLLRAEGRDEIFWMGLGEASEGFRCLMAEQPDRAEQHFVAAMHALRNFGYAYQGFQITVLLAGLRRCAEEIRIVRQQHKRVFDITLLPQLKLAEQVEESV
jgi:hypothetical protein